MAQNDQSPRIIAVTNQKGGVGKTTTSINLGAALAKFGKKTLIVDLDPQGNASTGLGIDRSSRKLTTYDVLMDGSTLAEAIQPTSSDNLSIVPATTDLSSADIDLMENEKRSSLLRQTLRQPYLKAEHYDYVLIDCPPSLSLMTVNGLVASDAVLVPLQSEFFALEGLSQLLLTVREVRETANPDLRIEGIVLTMFDVRNNLSKQVEQDARATLGDLVFKTVIPRNVRISEAPSFAVSVLDYDPESKGAKAYAALAEEISELSKAQKKEPA